MNTSIHRIHWEILLFNKYTLHWLQTELPVNERLRLLAALARQVNEFKTIPPRRVASRRCCLRWLRPRAITSHANHSKSFRKLRGPFDTAKFPPLFVTFFSRKRGRNLRCPPCSIFDELAGKPAVNWNFPSWSFAETRAAVACVTQSGNEVRLNFREYSEPPCWTATRIVRTFVWQFRRTRF